ncbi:glycosyl hydrolase family 18 protein [Falsibacillus albus]|uniref:Peptidoglycan hydrolase n=1 Tax=Falsibacillus albus TaxID=2478915 RepID=A0A3L7JZ45_9BACI|nr:glycosyl hydrolase family 18 protein [Falsibacillus albus]RLQ96158.1 peptidoglycan hydrolase [Falsibacillus albus]
MEVIQQERAPKTSVMFAIIACFLFLSITGYLLFYFYPFASNQKAAFKTAQHPIVFEDKIEGDAVIKNGVVYVPASFLMKHVDSSVYEDPATHSVVITTKNKVINMPDSSLKYYINERPVTLHFPINMEINKKQYIALDPLISFYPLQYKEFKETEIIQIEKDGETHLKGEVEGQDARPAFLRLRKEPDLQSPYVDQVENGEEVAIINEERGYYLARTDSGISGYIRKSYIHLKGKRTVHVRMDQESWKPIKSPLPIQLTWETVYSKNPDVKKLGELPGINIVSPTWFHLLNEKGDIDNLGSMEYVRWAQNHHNQIWGVFTNSFDPELTHEAFKSFESRQNIIRELIHYSKLYQLNGINLDIENVSFSDKEYVTQFVREAAARLHQAGLIISMDVTFISSSGNWSKFYDRQELARSVDYMIVMAYDEHGANSQTSGSVASIPWVENNLKALLKVVPNEKLVLGIPLFTRLWKEQKQSDGSLTVSSKALKMDEAKQWITERKLTPIYDQDSGQNFVSYTNEKEQATYKMWLEDECSLQNRTALAEKYQLAGVAAWARYFADQSAWTSLKNSMTALYQKK